jgi:hypothetical protein
MRACSHLQRLMACCEFVRLRYLLLMAPLSLSPLISVAFVNVVFWHCDAFNKVPVCACSFTAQVWLPK